MLNPPLKDNLSFVNWLVESHSESTGDDWLDLACNTRAKTAKAILIHLESAGFQYKRR